MKYTKPALTYDDQLRLLEGRGLKVADRDRARRWLQRIGYYRLSAYFLPFKVPGTDTFQPDTTIGQVTDLYKFDAHLRLLFMQAIDRVEVSLRAQITYELAHALGPFGYADAANFAPTYDHKHLLGLIAYEEKRGYELYVAHYRTKYTSEPQLPIWMVTELVSFGTLSKMTENLRASLRKQLAKGNGIAEPVYVSWLHTLTYVRNLCAHHNRLWNRELSVKPTLPHDWTAAGIDNDRIYCIALMLQHLIGVVAPQMKWKERLKQHFANYPAVDLKAMKFPENWKEIEPWIEAKNSCRFAHRQYRTPIRHPPRREAWQLFR